MVVGEGDVHHRPDLDPVAKRDRPLRDLVHAEDPGLRGVEDRRRHQRAVDAAIGDREGAAGEVLDRQLAVARLARNTFDLLAIGAGSSSPGGPSGSSVR